MAIYQVEITGAEQEHLKKLVKLGMFGDTPAAVLNSIIDRGLQQLVEKGHIKHPQQSDRRSK